MLIIFKKAAAFIKKDFLIHKSYRFYFILSWFSLFIPVMIFYYVAKLFNKTPVIHLEKYGGEYFPFVFIGIIFSGYLTIALTSFSANIRREQMMGTLEAILLTPTKPSVIVVSMFLWDFIFTSISVFIYLLLGVSFFGINLINANFFCAFIILTLTIISFVSIGVISASFIMVFKMGDPIALVVSLFSSLFGGVYFPVTVLPKGLQIVSQLLPLTYSLRALRYALLQRYTLKMLLSDISMLLLFCVILFPLSIQIFKYAVKRAKIEGSLAHY